MCPCPASTAKTDICTYATRSEIFPTHIRSQGMGIGMAGLYLADIILLVAGPIALDKIGWKFFLVLIIPTVLHILFVYFMCPETKGRSLVSRLKSCFLEALLEPNETSPPTGKHEHLLTAG